MGSLKCSYRENRRARSYVSMDLGFRLIGVLWGGQISWTYTSYMRSSFRRGGKVENSSGNYDIGFRSEWCL